MSVCECNMCVGTRVCLYAPGNALLQETRVWDYGSTLVLFPHLDLEVQ
jgi:hypothetical protein